MDLTGKIEIAGQSHTGLKRSHNEDCIGTDLSSGLVALADGMGGYKAGEVASALAINTLVVDITDRLPDIDHEDSNGGEFSPESVLAREVVEKSNDIIYQTALAQPQYKGMGTTLVMALFYDNRITNHYAVSDYGKVGPRALHHIALLGEPTENGFGEVIG